MAIQPGELTRYGPWLAGPVGRLHLAGEHTDQWQATMNGALASGQRAAGEILSLPIFPGITAAQQERVADVLASVLT